jgi:peptide deformylase
MLDLMRRSNGLGLAAPQAGLMIRLFVCNHSGEGPDDQVYINPTLEELVGSEEGEEGCLCLPGVLGPVARATSCGIRAVDLTGKPIVRSSDGLLARVWQHEVDHLAGRLIIDRMSPATKIANRRAIKYLETQFTED